MTDLDLLDDFDDDEPDFTALYGPHVHGDGWQMTPRMTWHLWSAARYLAEEWRASHPETLTDLLPRAAGPCVRDRAWRRRFVAGFEHIAGRLAAPDGDRVLACCRPRRSRSTSPSTSPKTTGSTTSSGPPASATFPITAPRTRPSFWMRDVLFEDHDFLMLFNPALDGIDLYTDDSSRLRTGNWFEPFRPSAD